MDASTLDHLYRITDPRRAIVPHSVVLSCRKCNVSRANMQADQASKSADTEMGAFEEPRKPWKQKQKTVKSEWTLFGILRKQKTTKTDNFTL